MPDEQRNSQIAQKVLKKFNEQDVVLVRELEPKGLHRWGSTWGAMTLTPYIRSLLTQPLVDSVPRMPFLIRLHVFSWFAAMAMLPATRLATVLVAGMHAAVNALTRPLAAAERTIEGWLAKHNPAAWLWPEED